MTSQTKFYGKESLWKRFVFFIFTFCIVFIFTQTLEKIFHIPSLQFGVTTTYERITLTSLIPFIIGFLVAAAIETLVCYSVAKKKQT